MDPNQQSTAQPQNNKQPQVIYAQKPPKPPLSKSQKTALASAIVFFSLWIIACGLPAYIPDDISLSGNVVHGFTSFMYGPFLLYNEISEFINGHSSSLGGIAWLFGNGGAFAAAGLAITALLERKQSTILYILIAGVVFSAIAFLSSFFCLTVHESITYDAMVPAHPGPAAYLWIFAIFSQLVMLIIALIQKKSQPLEQLGQPVPPTQNIPQA